MYDTRITFLQECCDTADAAIAIKMAVTKEALAPGLPVSGKNMLSLASNAAPTFFCRLRFVHLSLVVSVHNSSYNFIRLLTGRQ